MNCPNCGALMVDTYTCPNCGRKDPLARKIVQASNWHYNQGLAKAKVQDMTGATNSLLMSLKYNKHNTQARNLLGLIYYHIGEVIDALGEWVISVNFQPRDNIANTYIRAIQNNPEGLAQANRTIQKYNTALEYLHQGNMDVAIIELKKVLNLNPNYIKAYQLMALLYIRTKQYAAARKILVRALKIDRNNITSLRYIKEIDAIAGDNAKIKTRSRDGFTQINDPNPVVIEQKKDNKYTDFSTSLLTFVNVIIGVVIGAAVIWLLVVPSVKKNQATIFNQSVVEYSSQITEKNKLISSLEKEVEDYKSTNEVLTSQLQTGITSSQTSSSDTKLYRALKEYIAGNMSEAGLYLSDVTYDELTSDDARTLYVTIYEQTKVQTETALIRNGDSALANEEYMEAINYYNKVLRLNSSNVEVMYSMAGCYQKLADLDNAMIWYEKILNEYPSHGRAVDAAENIKRIRLASGQSADDIIVPQSQSEEESE